MPEPCDAKIRPFPNPVEVTCEHGSDPHDHHGAVLRDYAYPGSETVIQWRETDRRTYRGDWQPCTYRLCILPLNHGGRCAQ